MLWELDKLEKKAGLESESWPDCKLVKSKELAETERNRKSNSIVKNKQPVRRTEQFRLRTAFTRSGQRTYCWLLRMAKMSFGWLCYSRLSSFQQRGRSWRIESGLLWKAFGKNECYQRSRRSSIARKCISSLSGDVAATPSQALNPALSGQGASARISPSQPSQS